MSSKFKLMAASYVALLKEDKIFLIQRANTGYRDGMWGMPAGHIEENEMPNIAAMREAKEEAGVDIVSENCQQNVAQYRIHVGERTYADYLFICQKWTGEPTNVEADKSSAGAWFSFNNLPDVVPSELSLLNAYKNKITYVQYQEDAS